MSSLVYLWMDTVYLYLTVQQHRLISHSLAMAVVPFLCCQAITGPHYLTFFDSCSPVCFLC